MKTIPDGKIPPQAQEAEKSVLGCLLLDKQSIIKIADILTPEDFYHNHHSIIFKTILDLFRNAEPIDLVTVGTKLQARDELTTIGGPEYLAELQNSVAITSHLYQYAQIVKHRAVLRRLIQAGNTVKELGYKEDEEVESLLDLAQKAIFQISHDFIKDKFVPLPEVLNALFEIIAERKEKLELGVNDRISTGLKYIDKMLNGGFGPSDLVILAARPSMGKTALAIEMAKYAALSGKKKVGVISLEMSKEQLVQRILSSELGIEGWKIQTGQLTDDECAQFGVVMDKLSQASIFIDDSMGGSLVELRAKIQRLKMEHGLDALFIDYLQLMNAGGGRGFNANVNRVQEISTISRTLKEMAREMNIPVIALSQLSRGVESRQDKRPMLSDLRDSGAIEQDADIVMLLYRDDYYEKDSTDTNTLEVNVAKHRNGSIGNIKIGFDRSKMRFSDMDPNSGTMGNYERQAGGISQQAKRNYAG